MFVKVLTLLIVLAAIVWMLRPRRPAVVRAREAPPPPRVPHADELVKCTGCGIWLPAGQRCDCNARG